MRRVFVSLDERDLPEDGEVPEGYEPKYLEFVNPEIIMQEGEVLQYEGCLSFPGHNAAIRRPQKVTVRAFDRHGKPFTLTGEDMLARCIATRRTIWTALPSWTLPSSSMRIRSTTTRTKAQRRNEH